MNNKNKVDKSKFWMPYTQMKTASEPELVKSAKGLYLELEDSRQIMDCISSWWVILHGHCQKEIVDAISVQAGILEQVIAAGYTHQPVKELTKGLLEILPDHLKHIFYSDNGSTSIEVGLKMAFQYWKNKGVKDRTRFLCFEGDFHGDTIGAMSVADKSVFNNIFEELLFDCDYLLYPETFLNDQEFLEKEDKALIQLDGLLKKNGSKYAAMIIEPLVQGASGFRMCRPEFLRKLEKKLREYGILLIHDEVMTGFGRTGEWFACQKAGTTPDIICLSKGITGGFLPLAATVATEEIYQGFYDEDPKKTFYHGHSYTANPLGCAAAVASLKLLKQQKNKLLEIEKWQQKGLKMIHETGLIEKPRFMGTLSAMNVKIDKDYKFTQKDVSKVISLFLNKGFMMRPLGSTLYILPPYCINEDELLSIYQATIEVLKECNFN